MVVVAYTRRYIWLILIKQSNLTSISIRLSSAGPLSTYPHTTGPRRKEALRRAWCRGKAVEHRSIDPFHHLPMAKWNTQQCHHFFRLRQTAFRRNSTSHACTWVLVTGLRSATWMLSFPLWPPRSTAAFRQSQWVRDHHQYRPQQKADCQVSTLIQIKTAVCSLIEILPTLKVKTRL